MAAGGEYYIEGEQGSEGGRTFGEEPSEELRIGVALSDTAGEVLARAPGEPTDAAWSVIAEALDPA